MPQRPCIDFLNVSENPLAKGIFRRIELTRRLRDIDIPDAQKPQRVENDPSALREAEGTMMGITLLDQHVAVKPRKLGNGDNAD